MLLFYLQGNYPSLPPSTEGHWWWQLEPEGDDGAESNGEEDSDQDDGGGDGGSKREEAGYAEKEKEGEFPKEMPAEVDDTKGAEFEEEVTSEEGADTTSKKSPSPTTASRPPRRILDIVHNLSPHLTRGPYCIYLPAQQDRATGHYTVGSPVQGGLQRGLLLVGPQSSGKTSFVSALLNYAYDVRAEDPFRLAAAPHPDGQSPDPTISITQYTLNETANLSPGLRIVDMPGFHDAQTDESDRTALNRLRDIRTEERGAFAVCVVVPGPTSSLNPNVSRCINRVVQLSDDPGRVFAVATRCSGSEDDEEPQAAKALSTGGVKYQRMFKFNNKDFFETRENRREYTFADGVDDFREFFNAVLNDT